MEGKTFLKVGLAGCGRISSQHLTAMTLLKNQIKLMAVCDKDIKKAKTAGFKYNVPFYTDYKKLLKRNDIDLIIICTPIGLHYPMAIAAVRAGKHVLTEKPLALNLKQADELIRTFKKRKKQLFVVMQVRYNQALRVLREAIQKGKLGKIYNAALTIRWSRPQSYFAEAKWRGKKSLAGGALLNQGIHYVDALLRLLGEAKVLYGKVDTVAHNIEIEDQAFALLKFKNRAYGLIEFTINAYPENLECSITVLGEKGTVKLAGKAINEIEFWQVKNCPKPRIKKEIPNHLSVYQDIINYFEKGKRPFFGAKEARKSIEIIEAIYKSAKQNKEIKLPL